MGSKDKRVNYLLRRIREGDEKALETLYREFGTKFFAIARKYTDNDVQAEEALSDVFYELYTVTAKKFDSAKNGLNWLYKIIKHKALSYSRRKETSVENADKFYKAQDYIRDDGEYVDLKEAMKALTEEENTIMRLRFWECMTVREIAKELGQSHTTVFYKYKKALKKIEDNLR